MKHLGGVIERWRVFASVSASALALTAFIAFIGKHDPIERWLAWRYLAYVGGALAFCGACLSTGFHLAHALGLGRRSARQFLVAAFALGVLAFALAIVALGLVHALTPVTFFLLPTLMLASGARPLLRYLRRYLRRTARLAARPSLVASAARLLGALACLGLYFNILVPSNLLYDARWYHLPIAEHFAASGALTRFDEGWFLGALPHLSSWLYTWAFLLPAGHVHRLNLVAHLEYFLVLATVASLTVLIDALLPRPRLRATWVAFFLFPGVLLYDSGPGGGADHVLAFWAAPVFLASIHFARRPTATAGVWLGSMLAAAALTKYQAIYFLALPVAAAVLRANRERGRPSLTFLLTVALATAPHWLLNWLWYRNPIYPNGYGLFGGVPLAPGVEAALQLDAFEPVGTLAERLWETAHGVALFGFEAHDWSSFHGERPVFGSLFLPAIALAPFIRPRHRTLALGGAGLTGAVIWYWTYHQDRYLQALTPWFAAFVATAGVSAWRQFPLARPFLAALAGLQVLSCADIYFLPTHAMNAGGPPFLESARLVSSGHRKAYDEQDNSYSSLADADAVLPRDAKVLVHEMHLHLGINRPALRDSPGRQGGISYAHWGDSTTVHANLRDMGATHALWLGAPMGFTPVGDELVFRHFTQRLIAPRLLNSGAWVGELPTAPLSRDSRVAVFGCAQEVLSPVQLNQQWPRLRGATCADAPAEPITLDAGIEMAVVDSRRHPEPQLPGFTLLFVRDEFSLWGR